MEPVCLFHDDQDHGHLGSGLKLRSFISEGLHHPSDQNQHFATVTGGADACPKVEMMKSDADGEILLVTEVAKDAGRKFGKRSGGSGTIGAQSRITMVLNSVEENPSVGHEGVREDLDDIDAADMCFEGCVISTSPISNSMKQETQLEYENTYLESLNERDGMLIESVPASSPASFFQSETIRVSKDSSLVGHGDSWRHLSPSQQETEYHTSPSEFDLAEKRAADSIFPKEVTEGTFANDGISSQHVDVKNAQFNELSSYGLPEAEENFQSSKRNMEAMNHLEQSNTTRGSVPEDKIARLDLCLRSVLSDPLTGDFLDDAMVAQCGHSFGSGSLQKVMETHVCVTCGATASPDLLVPNFALRAAVLAYKQEDQFQMNFIRGLKRRREVSEQVEGSEAKRTERDTWGSVENISTDNSRLKIVQFPFTVGDRVLIKGNKRTPERFVGREAVITTQCLNGWYLVKALGTGDSVRLQYRSLQKLGDVEMPCTSEMEYVSEQDGDGSGSPIELSQVPTRAVANGGFESESPSSQPVVDTTTGKLGQHGLEEKNNTACSSEGDLIQPPYSFKAHFGNSNSMDSVTPSNTVEELLNNQGRNMEHRFMEERPKVSEHLRDQHRNIERCGVGAGQAVSDAMVEQFRTDLLNGISTFHDESGDEQMAQDGPQNETCSTLWVRTTSDALDTRNPNGVEVSLSKIMSTDPVGDATGGESLTANMDQEHENDSSRTRSRRTSLHSRNSLASEVCGQDSDPYRKVYSSGYRRRSGKVDTLVAVNPDDTVAESKVKFTAQGSVRSYSEALHCGGLGSGKLGRDMKVKSSTEILQIMRKDMINLEKQIPRCYLLSSWRSDRTRWRKAVKTSCTVVELGNLVRDFRYALLLTTAGGMTDEELEKRLTIISESGDVELLVSFWGTLYDDAYKCVESRPKSSSSLAHSLWKRLLAIESKDVKETDLSPSGQKRAAIVAVATVGDCQQKNSGADVKTLLASTMSLIQKQSRMELMSVKDALEREKRHIMAKLAKLEETYSKLGSNSSVETNLTVPKSPGEDSNGRLSGRVSMGTSKFCTGDPPVLSTLNDETDEGESDRVSPERDADGEATDLSDSD